MQPDYLDEKIERLELDKKIIKKLNQSDIIIVNDLWRLKRIDLKRIGIKPAEINQIIIKLQLKGLDLNKRNYNNLKKH
ncbi:MAG: hypothetical protein PHO63_01000 [Bacilli bacterium]|nr:hypothetical protein [Bacilli bacterium]MDD4808527.1 hypothetical protein [Bacilli bacterium]